MSALNVNLEWDPFAHQAQLIALRPHPLAVPGPITTAALGGWGSGKTYAMAMAFILACLARGWHPGYGKKQPEAIVMGPNLRHSRKIMLELIDSLLPQELVLDRKLMPEPRIVLTNGVLISAISADANYEGESLVACWIDEIQHEIYANNPERYTNLMARLRDPKCRRKHTRMMVTGLPTSGFVRDLFEVKGENRTKKTFLWSTAQNTALPEGVKAEILAATPAGMEDVYLRGQWMNLPDALYPQFREDHHLTDAPANPNAPVSFGLDAGNRSAAVIGQPTDDGGLMIVDEMLGQGLSVEELCGLVKASPWVIMQGKSRIFVDPTLRQDEKNAIRKIFPGIEVILRARDDEYYDVMRGVRCLQTKLRDATGKVLLTFARHLAGHRHGVIESFIRLRYNQRTGGLVVDDERDHPNDACRYLVCGMLGKKSFKPTVTPR